MSKKIYTLEEFNELQISEAQKMKQTDISQDALKLLRRADDYRWVHGTRFMGQPALQTPEDLFALQEIVFKTRPSYIIELGTAFGGTTLFLANLLKSFNIPIFSITAIDTFIPGDLKKRIAKLTKEYDLEHIIELYNGSSVDPKTVEYLKYKISTDDNVLVIIDSLHTEEHVLKELELYSQFLKSGNYMVVCDTIVDEILDPSRTRPWGPGNSPRSALNKFLETHKDFERDQYYENKLLLSCHPDGYVVKK